MNFLRVGLLLVSIGLLCEPEPLHLEIASRNLIEVTFNGIHATVRDILEFRYQDLVFYIPGSSINHFHDGIYSLDYVRSVLGKNKLVMHLDVMKMDITYELNYTVDDLLDLLPEVHKMYKEKNISLRNTLSQIAHKSTFNLQDPDVFWKLQLFLPQLDSTALVDSDYVIMGASTDSCSPKPILDPKKNLDEDLPNPIVFKDPCLHDSEILAIKAIDDPRPTTDLDNNSINPTAGPRPPIHPGGQTKSDQPKQIRNPVQVINLITEPVQQRLSINTNLQTFSRGTMRESSSVDFYNMYGTKLFRLNNHKKLYKISHIIKKMIKSNILQLTYGFAFSLISMLLALAAI